VLEDGGERCQGRRAASAFEGDTQRAIEIDRVDEGAELVEMCQLDLARARNATLDTREFDVVVAARDGAAGAGSSEASASDNPEIGRAGAG
jgi:hypothetical protein